MTESTPFNLNCPTCGAPLEVDGRSAIVRCKFCRNSSVVPGLLPPHPGRSQASLEEIRRLAGSGRLVEAIRIYRDLTGVGLKEAKQAVEALQAGRLAETSEAGTVSQAPEEYRRLIAEIQELLRSGKKIDAIKRYRLAYDVSLTRAKYAVENIQAGRLLHPEDGFQAPQAAPFQFRVRQENQQAAANQRRTAGCAAFLVASILIFVGGLLAVILFAPGGPIVPRLVASGPALLLPVEGHAAPDVLAPFYNADAETRTVGRVDGQTGKLLWHTEPLPGDGYLDGLAAGDGLLYVASDANLLAYRLEDGSLAWQAAMSDEMYPEEGNLRVTGERLLVLTMDQEVHAYETASGRLVWSWRMTGSSYRLRLVDGLVLLLEYPPDIYEYQLVFLDPRDGREERRLEPICGEDDFHTEHLDSYSGILYDPAAGALYLAYGTFTGCVDRYDLATGERTWQVTLEGGFSMASEGFQGLLTGDGLVFNDYHRLLAVDPAGASLRVLADDEDYEFVPLAELEDTLIVRARRTRGSERFELWGLEADRGDRLWSLDLSPSGPLEEAVGLVDESDPVWTWQTSPQGLQLIHFQAEPNRLVLETVDPATGTRSAGSGLDLGRISGDFYSIPEVVGWQERVLYFLAEASLYALDTSSGEMLLSYP